MNNVNMSCLLLVHFFSQLLTLIYLGRYHFNDDVPIPMFISNFLNFFHKYKFYIPTNINALKYSKLFKYLTSLSYNNFSFNVGIFELTRPTKLQVSEDSHTVVILCSSKSCFIHQ